MGTSTAQRLHLWEIADEIQGLAEKLVEAGGELTPELEEEFDRLEGDLETKVENTALYIQDLLANAEAAKSEEQRLRGIRKALENRANGLKDYLHFQLKRADRERIETPRVRVRIQANSRPSIGYVGDPNDLPEPFKKIDVKVDGRAAYEEWKDGGQLPDGFVVEHGDHLRIE